MFFHSILTQCRLFGNLAKNPKFWLILGVDTLLVVLAHYLAYAIRFESVLSAVTLGQFFELLPLLV